MMVSPWKWSGQFADLIDGWRNVPASKSVWRRSMSRKSTPGFDFGEALLGEGSRGWSLVWCCVEMGRWRVGELRVLVVPWLLEES